MPGLIGDQQQIASQSEFDPDQLDRDKVGGESLQSVHNATIAINRDTQYQVPNQPPNIDLQQLQVSHRWQMDDEANTIINSNANCVKIVKNA